MKLQRLLGALGAGLMLLTLPVRAAEQASYVTPVAGPMNMATFAGTYLNPGLRALATCHNGSTAPANGPSSLPLAYQCWVDTTANPSLYKIYDGASWITLGSINTSTHVWSPYFTGGVSGGVPFFSATNVMGSSAALALNGFVIGGGAGGAPATIAACTDDQIAFGRTGSTPLCRTVTGDITFAAGVSAIGATKVTSVMLNADVFSTAHSWAGQQAFVAPILGTPASGTLTNATGLPISTGVSGLASGIATWLATPSSANLRAALTDEVGSGAAYFVGGALGTPASGTATNLTGLPLSGLTAQGAYTIVANNSGSSAIPTAIDVPTITAKASPVSADIVLIQDSAASNAFKRTTVGALASAGSVASYNARTGSVTATGTDVPLRSYLAGLTLSTAGSSATFGIAAGVATDSTNVSMMALASAYTKTTSSWALGTAAGSLDTGAIANSTWYHVYLIQRPDTGVVDVLISLSASAPTMPTNYTLFRRIGSMKTNGSAQWIQFVQLGDEFLLSVALNEVNGTAAPTSATLLTLAGIPTGVQVQARLRVINTAGAVFLLVQSPDETSAVANATSGNDDLFTASASANLVVRTNTSAQVRWSASGAGSSTYIVAYGWYDTRGRFF